MAELKTRRNRKSVRKFIESVEQEGLRDAIIGFGTSTRKCFASWSASR